MTAQPKLDPHTLRETLGDTPDPDAVYDTFSDWVTSTVPFPVRSPTRYDSKPRAREG